MQKTAFKKLALLGLTSGLFVMQQAQAMDNSGQFSPGSAELNKCSGNGGCKSYDKCKSCKSYDKCNNGRCKAFRDSCKGANGCKGLIAENDKPKQPPSENPQQSKANDGNMNYHMMTEDELMLELNDEGARMYQGLSKEGKALALKVASGMCGGTNQCRKLNACKSDKNPCAGKGDCAGQGICAFSDKNLAVKVVYDKMHEKRQELTK